MAEAEADVIISRGDGILPNRGASTASMKLPGTGRTGGKILEVDEM